MFFKILQISQEIICARISFVLKLQADVRCSIKNTFFYRTPLVAASDYKYLILKSHRSSHPEVLCEKGVLENFTNFTGKHLFQSLFLKKVAGPGLSGVISNNRLPFSNLVFIICQQSRLKKQNISYIFFTCNKFL